ncbi:MAG: phenylalanine--tRNA ligase subunit alpha [Parcubacteria group bacterium]|nr:phenylalanine--tRNA ligase subunit alpha [Parcubacteria group bacterium]
MLESIAEIQKNALLAIKKAAAKTELSDIHTRYLGRKQGELNEILKKIKDLSAEEKKSIGSAANKTREILEKALADKHDELSAISIAGLSERLDITLPGMVPQELGHLHPLSQVQYEIEDIFTSMGFLVLDGPEVDSEYANFTSLNIPLLHPARDMHDTFWIDDTLLLRTHTSAMQVRALTEYGVPFRGIVPGRVYRYEATDASHEHTLNQLEGFVVDENISITDLIGTLRTMLSGIFKRDVQMRLRPSYFPFVEPGFELDIDCLICGGKGCQVCKHSGWVETLGCGMIHPQVLENAGIDHIKYSGFAFGLGLMRLVVLRYGIPDIRLLNSGDIRFLQQF